MRDDLPPAQKRTQDGEDPDPVPPMQDPRWRPWTRSLLGLLARPRRWRRMMDWGIAVGVNEAMLRQMVSALEEFGEAESVRHGLGMVWRRVVPREREWAAPSPDPEDA